MGWSYGINGEGREVGYAVDAVCDWDCSCGAKINRGLAYVCGGMHDGGEHGCGRYFCDEHITMGLGLPDQMCLVCAARFEAENPEIIAAAVASFDARLADADAG